MSLDKMYKEFAKSNGIEETEQEKKAFAAGYNLCRERMSDTFVLVWEDKTEKLAMNYKLVAKSPFGNLVITYPKSFIGSQKATLQYDSITHAVFRNVTEAQWEASTYIRNKIAGLINLVISKDEAT